jgi:hypothetical protein
VPLALVFAADARGVLRQEPVLRRTRHRARQKPPIAIPLPRPDVVGDEVGLSVQHQKEQQRRRERQERKKGHRLEPTKVLEQHQKLNHLKVDSPFELTNNAQQEERVQTNPGRQSDPEQQKREDVTEFQSMRFFSKTK